MQLKLTWRIAGQKQDVNVLVPQDQAIVETLAVLVERELIGREMVESVGYVRALRTNQLVNVRLTYKEGQIYAGDILQIESEEMGEENDS